MRPVPKKGKSRTTPPSVPPGVQPAEEVAFVLKVFQQPDGATAQHAREDGNAERSDRDRSSCRAKPATGEYQPQEGGPRNAEPDYRGTGLRPEQGDGCDEEGSTHQQQAVGLCRRHPREPALATGVRAAWGCAFDLAEE